MKSFGITSVLLLTLVLASPSTVEAQVLQPGELCGDHADAAIATFEDANLEAAIRGALSVGAQDDLTCGLVSGLTRLETEQAGIESLVGIQNLTSLTFLRIDGNSIIDVSALSGLTSISRLSLTSNSIIDISALSGLTRLGVLWLDSNPDLTDIQSLLDNTGLTACGFLFCINDLVRLVNTNVSCTDVAALAAKGVTVTSDCS